MSETARPVVDPSSGVPPGVMTDRVSAVAYPIASFAVLLLLWQFGVRAAGVPEYILPVPTEFLAKLWADRGLISQHTLVTSKEIILGFVIAPVISIPLGFLTVREPIERALYPLIVFFQLVPKIAVAPLFVVWFGFGLFPKVLLTFLLCFFPTLVASMTGFRALDERVLYLTRSMGATWWQTFRYVRMPAAMTYIFAGLKVSVVFAATGAIVGEFVGANAGSDICCCGHQLPRHAAHFCGAGGARVGRIFFSYMVQMPSAADAMATQVGRPC